MLTMLPMSFLLITGFSQDIETELVARYSFCGNLSDDSGNDNDGTYMGAADIATLKNYNGCSSSSINNLPELKNVVLFPNPVNEELTISYHDQHNYSIYLTDLLGNKVMTRTEQTATTMLDVRELTSGIYILHLVSKAGYFTKKVVKN